MPERAFLTETWDDDWFHKLSRDQRYLFIYLWTNIRCTPAGVYHINLATIASEAKFAEEELPELLKSLAPKVEWYPEINLVWVKNFLRHQAKSTKFIIAAIKSLNSHSIPEDIRNAFEQYNEALLHEVAPSPHISPTKRECVIIRDGFCCQYCGAEITNAADYEVDHIIPVSRGGKENYLNLVTACRSCNQKKLDKTPLEAGLPMPIAKPFHGAQATYMLKIDPALRKKWLQLFPDRYKVVESMLDNIDSTSVNINQCYPQILTRASNAGADTGASTTGPDTGAGKGRGKGVVKGETSPAKGKTKKQPDPVIAEILTEMKSFLGYPDKTDKDPIPNYAKEGQFLKKMLGRHFTREEILSCWKAKVQQRRGEFVSLAWVNEDIASFVHRREKGGSLGQQESRKERGDGEHQPDPVQAMREAGWDTDGEEPDEPGKANRGLPVRNLR
jgi:hypothetical protein